MGATLLAEAKTAGADTLQESNPDEHGGAKKEADPDGELILETAEQVLQINVDKKVAGQSATRKVIIAGDTLNIAGGENAQQIQNAEARNTVEKLVRVSVLVASKVVTDSRWASNAITLKFLLFN